LIEIPRDLNSDRALIFRITHRENVPWILKHGLHCKNSVTQHPKFHSIGNPEIISRRDRRSVDCPPGGHLSDYIPFYFTPCSPMFYNIKTGYGVEKRPNEEIVVLIASLRDVVSKYDVVTSDRNAVYAATRFSPGLEGLRRIDWSILQRRDFRQDPEDPGKIERYQAEAVIHGWLAAKDLLGIGCYTTRIRDRLKEEASPLDLDLYIEERPGWYF
jgi:hypothetical protein